MSNNRYKILVIEDEANIRNIVKTVLSTNDYQVLEASNAKDGKMMFFSYSPDIILLDLGLPDMDGVELIKVIREEYVVPIIVLSARTDESDIVNALDAGANDYVTKPFGTGELLARVRATLRSAHQQRNKVPDAGRKFYLKDLMIDYEQRVVMIGSEEVNLTQTEYNILVLLSIHAGRVMTYAEVIREIWRFSDAGSVKKLQVNMANIRKKLGIKPGENQYLVNKLGVGYMMNIEDTIDEA